MQFRNHKHMSILISIPCDLNLSCVLSKVNAFPCIKSPGVTLPTQECKTPNMQNINLELITPNPLSLSSKSNIMSAGPARKKEETTRVFYSTIIFGLRSSLPPCCIRSPLGEMKIISCTLANPVESKVIKRPGACTHTHTHTNGLIALR